MIRLISLRRDEGTILVFRGEDTDTSDHLEVAVDHRPGWDIARDLDAGMPVYINPEPWQVLVRWRPQLIARGAHL